jgi:hypothetical protein
VTFDWNGRWSVEATVPGGGAYAGAIDIAPFGGGLALGWTIEETGANPGDGRYFGVGIAAPEGLFVSCGPIIQGLSLILFDEKGSGLWLGADSDGAAVSAEIRARSDGEAAWYLSGSGVRRVALTPNGESFLAAIETGAGPREGLGWRCANRVAIAWGAPIERLVILFYPVPASLDGPVEARWALGRQPRLGSESLLRLR